MALAAAAVSSARVEGRPDMAAVKEIPVPTATRRIGATSVVHAREMSFEILARVPHGRAVEVDIVCVRARTVMLITTVRGGRSG